MLRIDRNNRSFSLLETPKLADVSITERYDLQECIANSPDAFCKEIGQNLFLLGKEVEPSETVSDRIDLLAVDKEGTCVIIELKRGSHKLHLFQAISYAGMIAKWTSDDLLQLLSPDRQEALEGFMDVELEEVNRKQRIILVAEAFDYALLVGAEWLSEQFGVDITCCRIAVARDETTNAEYLVCSNVFPAPELAQQAIPRRRKIDVTATKWADWEAAMAGIPNAAIVSFFKQELAQNRESYLAKRILRYRIAGKRRWFLAAHRQNVYGWQQGRFSDDVKFWQQGLSQPDNVKPVKNGECLRFFLSTDGDFRYFHQAATKNLLAVIWTDGSQTDEADEAEAEEQS